MATIISKKHKILFFIPFIVVTAILLYSWAEFIFGDYRPILQHYVAMILFLPIVYFLFADKSFKKPIVLTAIYLILAATGILSFFPFVTTSGIAIHIASNDFATPGLNMPSLLILILYGFLNFDALAEMYLDYKEARAKK